MVQHAQRFEVLDPDFVLMLTMKVSNTDDEATLLTRLSRLYVFLCGYSQGDAEQYIEDEQDAYEAMGRNHRGFSPMLMSGYPSLYIAIAFVVMVASLPSVMLMVFGRCRHGFHLQYFLWSPSA